MYVMKRVKRKIMMLKMKTKQNLTANIPCFVILFFFFINNHKVCTLKNKKKTKPEKNIAP